MDSPEGSSVGVLPCVNCGEEVLSNEGKLYAEVYVCPDCYAVAERMTERAHRELKLVLVMMRDAIRLGLLQKKLRFRTPEELKNVNKADFLSELGELVEKAKNRHAQESWNRSPTPPIQSGVSTKQLALNAASKRS